MAKGKTLLHVAGVLEIIFGCISLGLLIMALDSTNVEFLKSIGLGGSGQTLVNLALAWGSIALAFIAGIVALLVGSKPQHYKVCMFFGMVLILTAAANTVTGFDNITVQKVITYVCALFIPMLYYLGAAKNKESYERR